MTLLCGNLQRREELARDEDLHGLSTLLNGLRTIASLELQANSQEEVEPVSLKEALDSLRIITESAWRDIDGRIHWHVPAELPRVFAEAHGLLQAFLNLTRNSHRAVQETDSRELWIDVHLEPGKVVVRFRDSGPGIASPENLFQPLQAGAAGSGMGLYVSRYLVRSYGGELRYEPGDTGSCFAVELQAV
jgi:C4-dicarboxylate-specific signal transduction histidine kinase